MGNFLMFKPTIVGGGAYQSYCQMTLANIEKKLIQNFYQLQQNSNYHQKESTSSPSSSVLGNFGFSIDFEFFHRLFPHFSLEFAIQQFRLWDDDGDGLVEVLEIFSTCILFAVSSFNDKVGALFKLFDFDDSNGLNGREFDSLISAVSKSWNRLLQTERTKELHMEEMEEVAKRGMMYLTTHDQVNQDEKGNKCEITLNKLLIWCGSTGLILTNLTRHFTTDADTTKAYWTNIVAYSDIRKYPTMPTSTSSPSLSLSLSSSSSSSPSTSTIWKPFVPFGNDRSFRSDVHRIHLAFKSWIPNHRHQLTHRGVIDDDDNHHQMSPIVKQHQHHETQSKFNTPTASSLAKGITKKHQSSTSSSSSSSSAKLSDRLKALELKEHGILGGSAAHDRAMASVAATTHKATNIIPSKRERDRPAYLAIKKIKAKVQSRRGRDDPHYQHFVYDHNILRQAKNLFDSIDLDGSGEIEISELSSNLEGNPHLGAAISAFKSLDVDQTGTIDFSELLRALFPLATSHHVKMMSVEVKAIEVVKKDIEILQKMFEWLDDDFDGKVIFRDFLAYLRQPRTSSTDSLHRKDYARDYEPSKSIYELHDDRSLTFYDTIVELFTKSHMHILTDIKRWASHLPVYALTDQQHVELEQLFELYDSDGSGTIELSELVEHFTNLGFNEEDNERMFRMFIFREGSGAIDLIEFKRFYRSVYDSNKI